MSSRSVMRSCALLLALMVALPATAAGRNAALDAWFDAQLLPFVRDQLTTHPRFRGETVMFVVLADREPAAVSNELALSLRNRIVEMAIATSGIRIGTRQAHQGAHAAVTEDCTLDDVHYYVGLQVDVHGKDNARVALRALDLEDNNWVSGFGKSWQGSLSRAEYSASRTRRADSAFRGARDVPYSANETDLLARHLAHELSCALSRQTAGDYVVAAGAGRNDSAAETDGNVFAGTLELVGNNIAGSQSVELTADETRANARLQGKAHAIDDGLYQYWLTLAPVADSSDLGTLSASAYIRISPPASAGTGNAAGTADVFADTSTLSVRGRSHSPLLGPLSLAPAQRGSQLRATAYADAIVFFVQYQPRLGLVRLGDADCRPRTIARIARAGESLRFPVSYRSMGTAAYEQSEEWRVAPDRDTYYAVAVSQSRTARKLANHFDQLPMRCADSAQPGFTGAKRDDWLAEFEKLASRSAKHIDWRAIEIQDVL